MQIMQFIFGASYAAIYPFVKYTVPAQVHDINASAASLASAASNVASSAAAVVSSAGMAGLVKKLLFRAAGEEGLAENVNGASSLRMVSPRSTHSGEQYSIEYQTVSCITTSGQAFAVWLNLFYLAPLTALFVRFFIRSYLRRTSSKGSSSQTRGAAEHAGRDAIKGVERELYRNGGLDGSGVTSGVEATNGSATGRVNTRANSKANGKH